MNDNFLLPISIEAQVFALRVAVSGACVCGIVLVIDRLLHRRSEPLRYGILFAGILGLLAIPALVGVGASVTFWPETPPVEEEVVKVPVEMLPALLDTAPAQASADEAAPVWSAGHDLGAALVVLWLLGAAVGLGRLSWALGKQSRAVVGQPWHADFWTSELQAQLAGKLGLRKFPAVCVSPAAPMPMVIGLFRPTIVLPAQAPATWDQAKWQAILLHEAAHIARRDQWALVAQRSAVLLFWWCPLAHLVGRRLNALRENICDDHALEGPCDPLAYAELLVESAERFVEVKTMPVPLALLDSARGGLEARVTRLLEKEKRPMTKLTWFGKAAAAVVLMAGCLLTTAATALSQAQAPPQKKVQIKIIVDGKEIDLSDAKLWEHLEATQRKAAATEPLKLKVTTGKVDHADRAGVIEVALSPDGKILAAQGPGRKVFLYDAKTGKVIWQESVPAPADPRIEDLVKAAEKIKPGSGAEVRKALQGAVKKQPAPVVEYYRALEALGKAAQQKGTAGQLLQTLGDKKIIILTIQDGKVQQLSEHDLNQIRLWVTETKVAPGGIVPSRQNAPLVPGTRPTPVLPSKTVERPPPMPTPARTDLESLQRQLERINAELLDLRKRLDAGKK